MIKSDSGFYKSILYDKKLLLEMFGSKLNKTDSVYDFFETNPESKFVLVKNFLPSCELYCDFSNIRNFDYLKQRQLLLSAKKNENLYIKKLPTKQNVPFILCNNSVK